MEIFYINFKNGCSNKEKTVKKINSALVFLTAVTLLGIGSVTHTQPGNSNIINKVSAGLNQTHTGNYSDALVIFDEIIKEEPSNPAGYYFKAIVYQTIMRNYRISRFENQFDDLIEKAIQTGKDAVKQKNSNETNLLYLGGAYGYRALLKKRRGNWLGAFNDGRKGLSYVKKAVKKDPELYDAYLGLGIYDYWRSAKSRLFRIPLIFRDRRQRGINRILITIKNGEKMPTDGKYALTGIYYNEKDYLSALSVNQELFEQFPANPSCLYMRSRIFEQMENWKEALCAAQLLLKHLQESEYKSIGYEIECRYRLAYSYYQIGEMELARDYCVFASSLIQLRDKTAEIEGPHEKFESILSELFELQKEIESGLAEKESGAKHKGSGQPR